MSHPAPVALAATVSKQAQERIMISSHDITSLSNFKSLVPGRFNKASYKSEQKKALLTPVGKSQFEYYNCTIAQVKRDDLHNYESWDMDHVDDEFVSNEYTEEIITYLFELETRRMPSKHAIQLLQNDHNYSNARKQALSSIYHYRSELLVSSDAFFMAVNLFDRYASRCTIPTNFLEGYAAGCLFIASKSEDVWPLAVQNITSFINVDEEPITKEQLLQIEKEILRVLNYEVTFVNPLDHLKRLLSASPSEEISICSRYLLDMMALDYSFIEVKPSMCASIAAYISRAIFGTTDDEIWDNAMVQLSGGYTREDMMDSLFDLFNVLAFSSVECAPFENFDCSDLLYVSIEVREWVQMVTAQGDDES